MNVKDSDNCVLAEDIIQEGQNGIAIPSTRVKGANIVMNDSKDISLSKLITFKRMIFTGGEKKWQKIVFICLCSFIAVILVYGISMVVNSKTVDEGIRALPESILSRTFLLMLLIGFLAQMSDGSMGMGYGTIATTFLLASGVNPALVSSQVHTARVFSSGVSGYSHHRFGNINKKLFFALLIPGVAGAIAGAVAAYYGQGYAAYLRVPLSLYTLYLGFFIIRKTFRAKPRSGAAKHVGWLAAIGGFMDAFAGGGWGTLVTSTLMAKRKNPRFVIGSVCLTEFFVVFSSALTFFILLKHLPLLEIAGLIIGGLIAAPIAARLAGKLPLKTMFLLVGGIVVLASINTLYKTILHLL